MGQDNEVRQGADARLGESELRFRQLLAADRRTERRLFWRELIVFGIVLVVVLLRLRFGA